MQAYLLFIEPKSEKKLNRSNLHTYKWLKEALSTGVIGCFTPAHNKFSTKNTYLGVHTCSCGERSTSYDILMPNRMVSNSLAYHYVVYHTDEVPASEFAKLELLKAYLSMQIE